jgi:NCAIR mutase (PurE)-related protein
MDTHHLVHLLQQHRDGTLSTDEVLHKLRWPALDEEAGDFAKVDHHRRLRCGFPEVVFGQGKTPEQILSIMQTLRRQGEGALATRLAPDAASLLQQEFPEGQYNALGRTFRILPQNDPGAKLGKVVIVTAGTSDLAVAEEARVTAEAWNCEVSLIADVGVAGLHRLLGRLDSLGGADCVVVAAGMEGALPSVVGGLVNCPVIAVPTSVGYGASFGGLAALLGMLNSCASNVVAVNIDGGFNAGHVAGLIARRAGQARASHQVESTGRVSSSHGS